MIGDFPPHVQAEVQRILDARQLLAEIVAAAPDPDAALAAFEIASLKATTSSVEVWTYG